MREQLGHWGRSCKNLEMNPAQIVAHQVRWKKKERVLITCIILRKGKVRLPVHILSCCDVTCRRCGAFTCATIVKVIIKHIMVFFLSFSHCSPKYLLICNLKQNIPSIPFCCNFLLWAEICHKMSFRTSEGGASLEHLRVNSKAFYSCSVMWELQEEKLSEFNKSWHAAYRAYTHTIQCF